jgi:hypothetical protein
MTSQALSPQSLHSSIELSEVRAHVMFGGLNQMRLDLRLVAEAFPTAFELCITVAERFPRPRRETA